MTNTRKRKRANNNDRSNNNSSNNNAPKSFDNYMNYNFGMPSGLNMLDDLGLYNIINNTLFVTEHDVNERARYLRQLPHDHPCEWADDFRDDPDTYFLLQTDESGDVKGAMAAVLFDNEPKFRYNGIPFYYIDLRCSWGVSNDIFHTWGRILWANILHVINELENNGPFVVYNDAIPSAAGYHYKMGMRNLKTMIHENEHVVELQKKNSLKDIKDDIYKKYEQKYKRLQKKPDKRQVNEDIELGGTKKKDSYWNRGNMFYMKRQDINYKDIYSIVLSLSRESSIPKLYFTGGKKKIKTGKNKKKNKKNKTMKKRKYKKRS